MQDQLDCPYCDATLNGSVLSCRCCGRDLTPVLPLLRRIGALESRLALLEQPPKAPRFLAAVPDAPEGEAPDPGAILVTASRRRIWCLPVGFLVLMGAYWTVVIGLDLPLFALRLASMVIPFLTGIAYLGVRPRLAWSDFGVALIFAVSAVAAMNALLGWIDNMPVLPQGVAAWRETSFYALSIGASMFAGMLLRVSQAALAAKGLNSLPVLRDGLLGLNSNMPMNTLKAIEMTILLASTALSIMTGLIAGLLGVK
ncbi:hypothetical protein ASE63_14210 [Bosea sp. Root381]|uniref:hypothetical protein n=1 Tax=Bosea sp. Root381 TaxID=1736524 RepID=UPI0006F47170|nr:hypothetical protein [Bosea sp. Root381]KRE16871.1 hypothetical protein ASE63_14210 [Bosea sp. Root381]